MFKNSTTEYSQTTSQNSEVKSIAFKIKIIKLLIIVVIVLMIVINNFYGFLFPKQNLSCIDDTIDNLISPLSDYVKQYPIVVDLIQIVSNLCLDIFIGYAFIRWALYGKSNKFILAILFFYLFQFITQVIN